MNFYISKIRLWFRDGEKPRDLEFYNDKVNVITGDSSTGKSSVLKIIDYCLLSERSTIVEDVINENVAWYGMVFYIDEAPYTIIRQAPTIESAEMTVILKEGEYLPIQPVAGMKDIRAKAMVKMNELFHIPQKIKLESKVKLHFRHNLLFNYLTEDIIATENTYQDTRFFRREEYEKVLGDLFKMVIGVNEMQQRELESALQKARKEANGKREEQSKEIEKQEKYEKTRREIAEEADSLGLGDASDIHGNPVSWADKVRAIVNNCNLQFKSEQANLQRRDIERQLVNIGERIGYYTSLENEYRTYQKRLERQNESLVPLEYVEKHLSELMAYEETGRLLQELKEAWQGIKDSYEPVVKMPDNFENAKRALLQEERELRSKLRTLNPYQIEQRDIVWVRKAILLAERMEKELANVPKISITEEILTRCDEIVVTAEEALKRLRAKNDNALGRLNDYIEKYYRYQDGISEAYRDYKPVYSTDERMLMLEREGEEYAKSNVGSKSNYMFLHLCYFFGLHDLLKDNANKNVPQFLFIDQPSIPYYADKNERGVNDNDAIEKNDDQEKLREAFRLTDKFMKEMTLKGHFQIIMIEHAGEEYWQDLESFVTRYKFRRDDGLIPANVINKNND